MGGVDARAGLQSLRMAVGRSDQPWNQAIMKIEMLITNTQEAYIAAWQIRDRLLAGLVMVSVDRYRCCFEFTDGRRGLHWAKLDSQPPPPPEFQEQFIREIRFSQWGKPGMEVKIGHDVFPID